MVELTDQNARKSGPDHDYKDDCKSYQSKKRTLLSSSDNLIPDSEGRRCKLVWGKTQRTQRQQFSVRFENINVKK